jgi:hypothetical protein
VRVAGDGLPAVSVPDQLQRTQHGARVIPVAVRKHDRLHLPKIDAEARCVLLEGPVLRPRIEQDGALLTVMPDGDKAGQSVGRAAQAAAAENPRAASTSPESGELRFDKGRHRREVVGHVVDEDLYLDAAYRLKRAHRVRSPYVADELHHPAVRFRRAGSSRPISIGTSLRHERFVS